ncbi:SpoIIE family protein phosphatase [Streptomyces spororaveus]|uniref:SpoIIE family protein phosphatase n=1 Tax=Streptomyces spororaveus TaxID=284039 RepID=UPI00367CDC61
MEAIAFMGQVRTSLRALAQTTSDTREILGRANDLLIAMGAGLFATCCFLRFDPASRDLTVSRAGHVPMESGLAEVARLVRAGFDADPDVLASAVVKVADLTGHRDDAAVLVVRYDGPPEA